MGISYGKFVVQDIEFGISFKGASTSTADELKAGFRKIYEQSSNNWGFIDDIMKDESTDFGLKIKEYDEEGISIPED